MRVVHKCCAGIDVHKKTVVVCVKTAKGHETRTFGTTSSQLLALLDWLLDRKVSIAAMESTGVYWKPIWNVLEGSECQLMLVNAHHVKQVPGRKTDVKDAEWLAELLQHGLLNPSNVQPRPQRELQELVRYRRSVTKDRVKTISRIQKVLEGANVKLASVLSDITGKSGMAILRAMADGETDPVKLADLADPRLHEKRGELKEAVVGQIGAHQVFMLKSLLKALDDYDNSIGKLDTEVEKRLRPFAEKLKLLDTIPGVAKRGAEEIVAEIGVDMSRYGKPEKLASWAHVCPGNCISANKHLRKARAGRRSPYIRSLMTQLARGAIRTKESYYQAQHRRIKARRDGRIATGAVAHSMLVAVYKILETGRPFVDLGPDWFNKNNRDKLINRAVRRLNKLGLHVTLTHLQPAA